MSYAAGTTHYNLPQTVGTDKRDWTDTNQAFADLDAAVYQASQDASGAASDVSAVDARVTTLEGKMTTAESDIATLQASDTTQDTELLQHDQAINGLDTRVTALENGTGSVSVTIAATDTYDDMLTKLDNAMDLSKVTRNAYLVANNGSIFRISAKGATAAAFTGTSVNGSSGAVTHIIYRTNDHLARDTTITTAGTTTNNLLNNTVSGGYVGTLQLFY